MFLIFVIFLILNIILDLNGVMSSVHLALNIWVNNIFPSIFIFYNISSYLINNFIFAKISCLFKFLIKFDSKRAYNIFFASIFLGNPGSTKLINSSYCCKEISHYDFIKLNDCCIFVNPLFVISFLNLKFYLFYLTCCLIYIKLYDLLYSTNYPNIYTKTNYSCYDINSLFNSLNDSISILMNVCGLVTFFNIFKNTILFILNLFNFNYDFFTFLLAFLELASGLSSLKNCNELVIILLVSSQGLCILFQSYNLINKKNISFKRYILSHFISTISISLIFTILRLLFHI